MASAGGGNRNLRVYNVEREAVVSEILASRSGKAQWFLDRVAQSGAHFGRGRSGGRFGSGRVFEVPLI